jgi:hypothetical protein
MPLVGRHVSDTLTWTRGGQDAENGIRCTARPNHQLFPGLFGGRYTSNSLAAFSRGRAINAGEQYRQNFAGARTSGPYSRPIGVSTRAAAALWTMQNAVVS